ncbi:unnamed protein product [Ectocarpus sp. 12 AP-2014]
MCHTRVSSSNAGWAKAGNPFGSRDCEWRSTRHYRASKTVTSRVLVLYSGWAQAGAPFGAMDRGVRWLDMRQEEEEEEEEARRRERDARWSSDGGGKEEDASSTVRWEATEVEGGRNAPRWESSRMRLAHQAREAAAASWSSSLWGF